MINKVPPPQTSAPNKLDKAVRPMSQDASGVNFEESEVKKQDGVLISTTAKALASAASNPSLDAQRAQRLAELKEQVQSGTYKVNPQSLAKAMLQEALSNN